MEELALLRELRGGGTRPLGQLAAGALSDGLGTRGAIVVMATVGLVLTGAMVLALRRKPPLSPTV